MKTISLLGVDENGYRRSPLVPENVRAQLRWTLQSDVIIRVRVLLPNNAPRSMVGCTAVLGARKTPGAGAVLFAATGVVTGKNEVTFTLFSSYQNSWKPGWYVWEIWATDFDGNRFQLIPASPLLLDPVVLPAGTGGGGGVPIPTIPATFTAVAGETIVNTHLPVFIDTDGKLHVVDTHEIPITAMCGLNKAACSVGDPVEVYLPNQIVPGFAALTMGVELWASGGALKPYPTIGSLEWGRSVGYPLSTTELMFILGEALRHI